MGSFFGYIVGGLQIIVGTILTIVGVPQIGIPLIISGVGSIAGTALAPKPMGGRGGFEDSSTYGFDQITNAAFEGAPIPIAVGMVRLAPSYVSALTEMDGETQKLNAVLLICTAGRYGISALKRVWINDQPAESYDGVTIRYWPGKNWMTLGRTYPGGVSDTAVGHTWVKTEKTSTPYDVNVQLRGGENIDATEFTIGDSYTYTTKKAVDEIAIVLSWPGGLYQIDKDGKDAGSIDPATWTADVLYQDSGSTEWIRTGSTDKTEGWENTNGTRWSVKKKQRSVLRRVIRLKFASTKIRTVKITSTTENYQNAQVEWVNDAYIHRVEEITADKVDYSSYAIMEIEAAATNTLSGGLPTVEVEVDGWRCEPIAGGTASFSRNPVVILRELLLNSDDGIGDIVSASDIDSSGTWATVAAACEVLWQRAYKSFQLDLVLDTQQSAQDWIQHILTTFRCSMIEERGVLKLYQDTTTSSNRTFDARQSRSSANRPVLMLEDGRADIVEHEIPASERATHSKVIYFDERDGFNRTETPEYVDPDWTSTDPIVRKEYFLPGVTRSVQALKEVAYLRNRDRLRNTIVEFGVGPGDFDLRPLQVVTLYADNPALSGVTYQVLSLQHESALVGRVVALKYDADVYDDDYRNESLLTAADFLSRAEALKKAKQLPAGITDMKITTFTT